MGWLLAVGCRLGRAETERKEDFIVEIKVQALAPLSWLLASKVPRSTAEQVNNLRLRLKTTLRQGGVRARSSASQCSGPDPLGCRATEASGFCPPGQGQDRTRWLVFQVAAPRLQQAQLEKSGIIPWHVLEYSSRRCSRDGLFLSLSSRTRKWKH